MPDRGEFPDAEGGLVSSLAREESKVCHRCTVLVEDGFPDFVVPAPRANDEEIEVAPAPVQDDEAEAARFERALRQIGPCEAIDLLWHRLVLWSERLPLQDCAAGFDRVAGCDPFFPCVPVALLYPEVVSENVGEAR